MRELAIFPIKRFRPRHYRPGNLGTWSGHLPFAHDIVAETRPSVLVELGTHFGESYFGFCQSVDENGLGCECYAVDTWRGDEHAGFYDDDLYEEVSDYNQANYASYSSLLRETFDQASSRFGTWSIDLLHIDGLHTYDAVKHDFETWLPKVRPGGIILLHDTNARHAKFEVWRLWDELKTKYPHFEFMHSWGLGVLRIGTPAGEEAELPRHLFRSSEADCRVIRELYAREADFLELAHQVEDLPRTGQGKPKIQVFAGRLAGYQEEHSAWNYIERGVWQTHHLRIEQGCEIPALRIDLVDGPGVIELAGIKIRRAVDSVVLVNLTNAAELMALPCSGELQALEEGPEAIFLSYGSDPHLLVSLDEAMGIHQPMIVEVWMKLRSDAADVASFIRSRALAQRVQEDLNKTEAGRLAAERDRMSVERATALQKTEALIAEIRLHQTERISLTSEFRRFAESRRTLETQSDDARERLRREQSLRISLEKESAELRKEAEQLRWTVAQHEHELAELRSGPEERDALQRQLAQAERVARTLEEELRNEKGRRRDLEASYSWRVTRPVRGAASLLRLPHAGRDPSR